MHASASPLSFSTSVNPLECIFHTFSHILPHTPTAAQFANVDNSVQNEIMNEAKANMAEWPNKTVFIKTFTSLAVHHVPGLVDFIYVDARHDYCGVGAGVRVWSVYLVREGQSRGCLVGDCLRRHAYQHIHPTTRLQ